MSKGMAKVLAWERRVAEVGLAEAWREYEAERRARGEDPHNVLVDPETDEVLATWESS